MAGRRSISLAAFCIAAHAPLAAATVAIEGDRPRERITVTIQDASIGATLRDLGQAYGFEVRGAIAGDGQSISATLSGSLGEVLARLLRNVDHVIMRSADHRGGIAKVIVTGGSALRPSAASGSADVASPASEPPSSSAPMDDD